MDIQPERKNIQIEEIAHRAAVSEGAGYRMGAAVNFINNRQFQHYKLICAGRYGVVATRLGLPLLGFAAKFIANVNCEIMGIALESGVVGSSGSTVLDIHHITDNGDTDNGSIFSVKPSVASTAASGKFGGFYWDPQTESIVTFGTTPTGFTLPTFISLPFPLNQGEALRFDLDSVMGGDPKGIDLTLYTRPR